MAEPTQRRPWIEREFDFDFSVEEYPAILRRLAATPDILERVTLHLDPPVRRRRVHGKWSILEHAGHLFDLEALGFARLEDFLVGRPMLTPADMSNTATEHADHNTSRIEDILEDFYLARTALVQQLETLEPRDFQRASRHPRLHRRMRIVDWMLFMAEHDDHHLGLIADLANLD